MYVLPDSLVPGIILDIEGDVALFPAAFVLRLFTNNHTPDKADLVGAYTELTNLEVPGYAAIAPAWNGTPLRKQDGSWEDLGGLQSFVAAGGPPPVPLTVYGWFLTNAAGTVLLGAGLLSVPFTFTADGDGLVLEPSINLLQLDDTHYQLTMDMEEE